MCFVQDGGGAVGAELEAEAKKSMTDLEAVAHHSNGEDVYREVLHSFCAGALVDFTPLNDNAAFAALQLGIPYLGIAFNEFHQEALRQRLVSRVFQAPDWKSSVVGHQTLQFIYTPPCIISYKVSEMKINSPGADRSHQRFL